MYDNNIPDEILRWTGRLGPAGGLQWIPNCPVLDQCLLHDHQVVASESAVTGGEGDDLDTREM